MYQFRSIEEVSNAIEHFLLRTSKTTGQQVSESTRRNTRYYFTDKVKATFCSGITGGDLMRAVDAALADESKSHRTIGLVIISQFANYYDLIDDETHSWWAREGNRRYKPNKPVSERILTKEELKKYFDVFLTDDPSNFVRTRLYLFSAMLLLTGARSKAISELMMSDITLTESELTVSMRRLKSANTERQVIHVPLDVKLPNGRAFGEPLYRYLAIHPGTKELFVDIYGKRGTGILTGLSHSMFLNAKAAGLKRVSAHMFRFTCASIVADYVGIKQAQQLLGHSDMKTTLRYAGQSYANTSRSTITAGFASLTESLEGVTS